jgi:putative membrane protein
MRFKTILALLMMMLVTLFSVQNAEVITVRFLHWQFTLSLALVIMVATFSGVLFGLVIGALSRLMRPRARNNPTTLPPPRS